MRAFAFICNGMSPKQELTMTTTVLIVDNNSNSCLTVITGIAVVTSHSSHKHNSFSNTVNSSVAKKDNSVQVHIAAIVQKRHYLNREGNSQQRLWLCCSVTITLA